MPKPSRAQLPPVPAALHDVALIDGPTAAAACGISLSQWSALVREGDAPKPAVQEPRCTRWLLTDVRTYLQQRVARAAAPKLVRESAA